MILRRKPTNYVEWRELYQGQLMTLGRIAMNYMSYRYVMRMPEILDAIKGAPAIRDMWRSVNRLRRIEARLDENRDDTFYTALLASRPFSPPPRRRKEGGDVE